MAVIVDRGRSTAHPEVGQAPVVETVLQGYWVRIQTASGKVWLHCLALPDVTYPDVDIAVDPVDGTSLCATGAANSIAVLAARGAERAAARAGLLHGEDHRRTGLPRRARPGRPGEVQPESHRALPGPGD